LGLAPREAGKLTCGVSVARLGPGAWLKVDWHAPTPAEATSFDVRYPIPDPNPSASGNCRVPQSPGLHRRNLALAVMVRVFSLCAMPARQSNW
jgi:hypothetical protein